MENGCVAWNAFVKEGSVATYLLYKACKTINSCDGGLNINECQGTCDKSKQCR